MKLIFLLMLFISLNQEAPFNGTLTINITGINQSVGTIQLGLFNNERDFPRKNKEFKKIAFRAHAPNTTYTLNDLPPGDYAIAVFHDENMDGKCNRNPLGIPTEGYGFSNNVLPKLRPPSFKNAKFKMAKTTSISISMVY